MILTVLEYRSIFVNIAAGKSAVYGEPVGSRSSWSDAYKFNAIANCRRLLRQTVRRVFSLAVLNAVSTRAARMAIIEMTTSNSINEKPAAPRQIRPPRFGDM